MGKIQGCGVLSETSFLAKAKEGEEGSGTGKLLDPNKRNLQGRIALHIYTDRGHIDMIKVLRKTYSMLEEKGK